MKIKVKISKAMHDTLPPLEEGMKWKFEECAPKKGELILTRDEFVKAKGSCSEYLTATQVPIKINLKKMLKELGETMPDKVKGYKMQYAGVAVKGLKEYLYSFNGGWARGGDAESAGQFNIHYIELIPTKTLAKALAEIERITK